MRGVRACKVTEGVRACKAAHLVEEQEPRGAHERARDAHALALPAREAGVGDRSACEGVITLQPRGAVSGRRKVMWWGDACMASCHGFIASCLLHLGELGDEGVRVRHLGALDRASLEVREHLREGCV